MLYKTLSAAVYGIDANIIEVEVDVSGIKMPEDHFHTVGLPDAAVRESRDRVRAALKNCGYDIPPTHITINLAPADIKTRRLRLRSPHGARHSWRLRRPQ
jgi:magnesium chelatase family protein